MKKRRDSGDLVVYGSSEHIAAALDRTFASLEKENCLRGLDADAMAGRLARFYSELDATHPFREGNSRALRAFTSDLSDAAGFRLAWSGMAQTEEQRHALYHARDLAVMCGELSSLEKMIRANLHTR